MQPFYKNLTKAVNSGQSKSVLLTGNTDDIYWDGDKYSGIIDFILNKTKATENIIHVFCELNGPVKIKTNKKVLSDKWKEVRKGSLEEQIHSSQGDITYSLELLRQLCLLSRNHLPNYNLIIAIESCDLIIPSYQSYLQNESIVKRISILKDWFTEQEFVEGQDAVILVSKNSTTLAKEITSLPQVVEIKIPNPSSEDRLQYINSNNLNIPEDVKSNLVNNTAGLSLYSLRQILKQAAKYGVELLSNGIVFDQVERYFKSQVGEDSIEFKKPKHKIDDLVGFSDLKSFLTVEMIPRIKEGGDKAISGAIVCGPIGSGKTYIFEAVAAELNIPVLILKNLRSKWYGETDVIFEALRRTIEPLEKVLIFVDEADTQFGKIDDNAHETEKRLTGKIQQMMSDSKLKGKVIWLLMTARIDKLSADIRRPGRCGDLIIPVLDPESEDRILFIKWVLNGYTFPANAIEKLNKIFPKQYSSACFAAFKSFLNAHVEKNTQVSTEKLIELANELMLPDIEEERAMQTKNALLNCTRRSLLPRPKKRSIFSKWFY